MKKYLWLGLALLAMSCSSDDDGEYFGQEGAYLAMNIGDGYAPNTPSYISTNTSKDIKMYIYYKYGSITNVDYDISNYKIYTNDLNLISISKDFKIKGLTPGIATIHAERANLMVSNTITVYENKPVNFSINLLNIDNDLVGSRDGYVKTFYSPRNKSEQIGFGGLGVSAFLSDTGVKYVVNDLACPIEMDGTSVEYVPNSKGLLRCPKCKSEYRTSSYHCFPESDPARKMGATLNHYTIKHSSNGIYIITNPNYKK